MAREATPIDHSLIERFTAGFIDDPGYLDFARLAPIGEHALFEVRAMIDVMSRARFGSLAILDEQDARVRETVADLVRVRSDQVVFQPSASQAFMQVMFGLTGGVAASAGVSPSVGYAMARAADSLGVLVPHAIVPHHERITPGVIRDQLASTVVAVVVGLVDYRTGHLVDLEGIRQVIDDRLLIVDGSQSVGIVDAPWEAADVVISSGQTWLRAGQGTGFLAMNDRARERLTPVWSGWLAHGVSAPGDAVQMPASDAGAFSVGAGDSFAQARLAGAIEAILAVGVPAIGGVVLDRTARLIEIADAAGVEVVSPRDDRERAGIVVLEPHPEFVSALAAALFNHGVSTSVFDGRIRLSAHVTTGDDTLELFQASLHEFRSAARP